MKKKTLVTSLLGATVLSVLSTNVNANRVAGPIYSPARVIQAFKCQDVRIKYRGGERAWAGIMGDGHTNLDLYTLDPEGNVVAKDIDPTDEPVVGFHPERTDIYTLCVCNKGNDFNRYTLEVK